MFVEKLEAKLFSCRLIGLSSLFWLGNALAVRFS
jgi:hypothetical protein